MDGQGFWGLDNVTGKDDFLTTNDYTNGCRMDGYLRCKIGMVLIILPRRLEYLFAGLLKILAQCHWSIGLDGVSHVRGSFTVVIIYNGE